MYQWFCLPVAIVSHVAHLVLGVTPLKVSPKLESEIPNKIVLCDLST